MSKVFALAVLLVPALAYADPVWAVRPEPGLVCMTASTRVQILDQPNADGHPIALSGPVVFALRPPHTENGFVAIERPNRQVGWIQQSAVTPGPDHCVPTLMSNGLILTGDPR